ncbi:unnamed protein product [Clonostachys rosea]|uniref:Ribosomal protein S24/S35 mitochondrial conserved domain-containing protein n=1 Tax=Bionectria ochroleuca TaxID=29856 RepID=A0ABY6V163_BIOOC|nr:unnamed protein product [Clonostachys rosea]
MTAPSLRSQGTSIGSFGHSRRKSLGLSFMLNKQAGPVEPAAVVDPAAAHYQDPEARMKLRAYLASPQKFDEALEFGFPSRDDDDRDDRRPKHDDDEIDPMDQLRSFLDDDKSSTYSDNSTVDDLESPKTPPMLDKPLPLLPAGGKCGDAFVVKPQDYQNGTHREMTLRMTLTRPDLRANEDDIYRWQQSVEVRKAHMRGEILAPVSLNKNLDAKSRIDKELAAIDQENYNQAEGGMVKRLWKRVRRT